MLRAGLRRRAARHEIGCGEAGLLISVIYGCCIACRVCAAGETTWYTAKRHETECGGFFSRRDARANWVLLANEPVISVPVRQSLSVYGANSCRCIKTRKYNGLLSFSIATRSREPDADDGLILTAAIARRSG
jgi:hypothetical protein